MRKVCLSHNIPNYHTACSRESNQSGFLTVVIPTHLSLGQAEKGTYTLNLLFEALENNRTLHIFLHLEMGFSSMEGLSQLTEADSISAAPLSLLTPLVSALVSSAFNGRPSKVLYYLEQFFWKVIW